MKLETKKAMNRLVACAFNNSTDAEKDAAVTDAFEKLQQADPANKEMSP